MPQLKDFDKENPQPKQGSFGEVWGDKKDEVKIRKAPNFGAEIKGVTTKAINPKSSQLAGIATGTQGHKDFMQFSQGKNDPDLMMKFINLRYPNASKEEKIGYLNELSRNVPKNFQTPEKRDTSPTWRDTLLSQPSSLFAEKEKKRKQEMKEAEKKRKADEEYRKVHGKLPEMPKKQLWLDKTK